MLAPMTRRGFVLGCLLLSACKPPAPRPVSLAPTPALQEEALRPIERPQLRILDLHETPSPDGKRIMLTGTLKNDGVGPTHELVINIEGRDDNNAVVCSAQAVPSTEEVLPGDTVSFTATLDNRPETVDYHVEAIGR
jgi:hypothetical protein